MTRAQKFWTAIGTIALILGNICIYLAIILMRQQDAEIDYCGTIQYKSADEVTIKHGTRTDLYLIIDFEEIGRKDIKVSVGTYMSHEVGDRVCFGLDASQDDRYEANNGWRFLYFIITICCGFIALCADLYYLFMLGEHLIDKFNNFLNRNEHD